MWLGRMDSVAVQSVTNAAGRQRLARRKAPQWRVDLVGLAFVAPFLIAYGLFVLWPIARGLYLSLFNWSLLAPRTTPASIITAL